LCIPCLIGLCRGFCSCTSDDPYFEASSSGVQVLQEGAFLTWKPTAPTTATADANDDPISPEQTLTAAPTTIIAKIAENNREEEGEDASGSASEWSSFNVSFTGSIRNRFEASFLIALFKT